DRPPHIAPRVHRPLSLIRREEAPTSGRMLERRISPFGWAIALTCAALATEPAQAQELFSHDFEGASFVPPWTRFDNAPNSTLTRVAEGAHRGCQGARLVDTGTARGQSDEDCVAYGFTVTTGAIYSRFWFRLTSTTNDGVAY